MKPGQKVICIGKYPWIGNKDKKVYPGPKFGEICTFTSMGLTNESIHLLEHKDGPYNKAFFRPLEDHKASVKNLNVQIIETPEISEPQELSTLSDLFGSYNFTN